MAYNSRGVTGVTNIEVESALPGPVKGGAISGLGLQHTLFLWPLLVTWATDAHVINADANCSIIQIWPLAAAQAQIS